MIVTGNQIRAARALLNWTQTQLAEAAGVHANAIAYWEGREQIPWGLYLQPWACRRIREALLRGGVDFLQSPVVGVRLIATHNNCTSTRKRARAHHGVLQILRTRKTQSSSNTLKPARAKHVTPPRCAAKTRTGRPCLRKAMLNGRCRNHGGLSSGPKSDAGRQRIAEAQKQRWERWRRQRTLTAIVTDSSEG
jgi:transcriptional regulator with XRE-family HTH domain